jgi:hypothetical protein
MKSFSLPKNRTHTIRPWALNHSPNLSHRDNHPKTKHSSDFKYYSRYLSVQNVDEIETQNALLGVKSMAIDLDGIPLKLFFLRSLDV